MTQRTEAPLTLLFIALGVWSAASGDNVFYTIGLLGLGVAQTIFYGRRYIQQKRARLIAPFASVWCPR